MKTHLVKWGDSFTKLAISNYGDPSKASIIAEANSHITKGRGISLEKLPIIYEGDIVNIPDIPGNIKAIDEELVSSDDPNEIKILIDGKEFSLWQTAEIVRSFDVVADTFDLTSPWDPDSQDKMYFMPFSYKQFSLFIGGERLMKGNVISHTPQSTANSNVMTISGYSTPGVLSDVQLPPSLYPFESAGLDLKQVAEKICRPWGIPVEFPHGAGPAFTKKEKLDISPTQTIYNYLIDLARQRGFVITADIKGTLIFQKTTDIPATEKIMAGYPPFVKSSAKYDGQKRFSEIHVLSTEAVKGAGKRVLVADNSILKTGQLRPKVIKAPKISSDDLSAAAAAQYGRSLAACASFTVTVTGWRRQVDGQLWADNTRVIYQNKGDFVYTETEMLIREVKFIKTPNSQVTELKLVFPECYSGKIRESFPWD